MTSRVPIYSIILAALAGCVSTYRVTGQGDSASLTVAGNSNNFFIDSYKDESCKISPRGERLATFYGPTANVKDHEKGATISVAARESFLMTFHYIDAKGGLNRVCDMTVGFMPEPRSAYRAYFNVEPGVSGCGVSLMETTDGKEQEVPSFFVSDHVCLGGRNIGPLNGRPQRIGFRFEIHRY